MKLKMSYIVTPKPTTKLLHVVHIYNGIGYTMVALSKFVLHQSFMHPVQAIVLGLIDLTYIGLTCNHIGIRSTYSRKWLMFSKLNKT